MPTKVSPSDLKKRKRNPKGKVDPVELLKSLPGRGKTNSPPIPNEYYDYQWAVYATDDILRQSLIHYINQKQSGDCQEIFYKGKKLDVYIMPAEGVDLAKEKIRNLGNKKSEKNFVLHKKLKPKTSQWTLHLWK